MKHSIPVGQSSFINKELSREKYYIWQWDVHPSYPGVYFIYNKKDELIYVGKAENINKRLKKHYEGNTHLSPYKDHFYRVETHEVTTGRMDCLFYEIYYINNYKPIFNKENVLYTNLEKVNKRIDTYLSSCVPLITERTEAEKTQEDLGLPPEDGHLFSLWTNIQFGKNLNHSYHCNQGGSVANKVLKQWVANKKGNFMSIIQDYYMLPSIQEVENQLKDYVRWDKKNIFSVSSSPNPREGWNERAIADQYF